jgi:hypothetical protein
LLLSIPNGAIPAVAGTGLPTNFYNFSTAPTNIANSDAIVSTFGPPTATFTTLTPVFPPGGSSVSETDLQGFVGASGTNFSSDPATDHNSYFLITGFLAVRTAGTQQFQLKSDDGSQLILGGQLFLNNDGDHGFQGPTDTVTFAQPGLYSFQLKFFEDGGGIGMSLLQDINNVGVFGGIATSDLYASLGAVSGVPEPATFAFAASALVALALRRRLR